MTSPASMLKAASLWEKTSAAGNRYFIGRFGGVRILILENRSRGAEGEPDWQLFFCDGEKRDSRAETPASAARAAREPRRSATYPARRPARRDQPGATPDDRLDDIGRGGAP